MKPTLYSLLNSLHFPTFMNSSGPTHMEFGEIYQAVAACLLNPNLTVRIVRGVCEGASPNISAAEELLKTGDKNSKRAG
jgi:hypothetical protein